MSFVKSALIFIVSLAPIACAEPKFPPVDGSAPDTSPATIPPVENYTCEEPDQVVCTPAGCGKICHKTDVPRQAVFSHCEKPAVVDGARYDDCDDHSICLEPAPNTSQGYFCLALCRNATDCSGGVACGERLLSADTTVRVCDPSYLNCEASCCDPTDNTGSACAFNRPCYLVVAPSINREASWTVCEYASGAASKGQPCTLARDCLEGLTCVAADSAVNGSGTCLVVCDPSKPGACGVNGHCQPFPKQWGYCP